jgi:translation initiation factor 4E
MSEAGNKPEQVEEGEIATGNIYCPIHSPAIFTVITSAVTNFHVFLLSQESPTFRRSTRWKPNGRYGSITHTENRSNRSGDRLCELSTHLALWRTFGGKSRLLKSMQSTCWCQTFKHLNRHPTHAANFSGFLCVTLSFRRVVSPIFTHAHNPLVSFRFYVCSLYNNVIPPSRLPLGSDLHLFREGIEPKWEDASCEHGGKWTITLNKSNQSVLDHNWLHVVLSCIGEHYDDGDEICGVVVNVRPKQNRISIWTKTAANEAAQVAIGRQLKEICGIGENTRIGYLPHADAKNERKPQDRYSI